MGYGLGKKKPSVLWTVVRDLTKIILSTKGIPLMAQYTNDINQKCIPYSDDEETLHQDISSVGRFSQVPNEIWSSLDDLTVRVWGVPFLGVKADALPWL